MTNEKKATWEFGLKAKVHITLKNGVLDPQGKAVENALHGLGFGGVSGVRQGKYIELDVKAGDKAAAKKDVENMCRTLLANTVIENFSVEVVD